jgi:GT2 family glycosyltransferase
VRSKVAVVILNWNGIELLKEFLPSVVNTVPDYVKVVLLDNASSDGSVNFVKQHYPNIDILHNDDNYGFALGYNKGLINVDAEYFVLLNSDIQCAKGWVEPIIDFMDNNPKVGACQPKILDYKSKGSFEYAGASGGHLDAFGFPFCRGRIFNELELDEGQYEENSKIFWATGACLFIRSDVFNDLNGFDEDFFAHMEEIDLCWRIHRAGHEIYCIPESKIYHLGGGTLKKLNPQKTYLNFRNNLIMILKNNRRKYFYLTILLKLIFDGIAGVKFLLEGSPLHTWSVVKAHFYVYGHIGAILKKRRDLKKVFPKTIIHPVYSKSIVISHYLLGKKTFKELKFNTGK